MTPTLRVPLHEHPAFPRRLCRTGNPNRFCQLDGEQWSKAEPRLRYAAQTVCVYCPVLEACREAGKDQDCGMWGGVAKQRRGDGSVRSVDLLRERP